MKTRNEDSSHEMKARNLTVVMNRKDKRKHSHTDPTTMTRKCTVGRWIVKEKSTNAPTALLCILININVGRAVTGDGTSCKLITIGN